MASDAQWENPKSKECISPLHKVAGAVTVKALPAVTLANTYSASSASFSLEAVKMIGS